MKNFVIIILTFCGSSMMFSQEISRDNIAFSDSGGIYANSVELTLNASTDKIYYTTDGSNPSSSSQKYNSPIILDKTTVIRAIAYTDGKRSNVATQTYFIGRTYNMAVISIAGNPDDFFGFERGIYVKGCCADSVPPYRHANYWRGWERKVNIEFYEPTGELGFNQEVGIRIFGGFSKGLPMKSLAIISRKKYGEKRMRYSIFPNKDIKKFKSIVLRNSGSDFNNTHFRDAVLTNLVEPLDIEIQAYRPAVVYINGTYWGVHNVREKINEYYLKSNCGANRDSVDIMKHRNDLLTGTRDNYLAMKKYITKTDFSDTAEIHHLNTLMDIDNFINYNITEVYIDNRDAGGNIRYWRPQVENSRWRWILFDTDISFGISGKKAFKKNTLDKMTNKYNEIWPDPPWSTLIIRNLLENDSIKNVYINRFADHLNTIFSAKNVAFKIDSVQNLIRSEMPFHFEKWRSGNLERWERNVQKMRDFALQRPYYVRQHLMERFELKDTVVVEIVNPSPKMGHVQINSITVFDSFTGIYFKEAPASIQAISAEGYEFEKWTESNASPLFLLTENMSLTPIFIKKEPSPFMKKIVFNEISAHQDSLRNTGDWIELYNNSNKDIDVSNWRFISNDNEITFPNSTKIKANTYVIIARNPKKIKATIDCEVISIPKGLSSVKELFLLIDSSGFIVDSLRYNFEKDFPSLVNSVNKNIERINPELTNWEASKKTTPNAQNDLFEPLKTEVKPTPANRNYLIYIGGGILGIGVFLITFLIIRKKDKIR